MYDVLIAEQEKIIPIENIQTSIEISDEVIIENKEPTKKRAKTASSSSSSSLSSSPTKRKVTKTSPPSSSSTSSSPDAIFLHIENTLPKCTVANPDLIENVMVTISNAIGKYLTVPMYVWSYMRTLEHAKKG